MQNLTQLRTKHVHVPLMAGTESKRFARWTGRTPSVRKTCAPAGTKATVRHSLNREKREVEEVALNLLKVQ